MIARRGRELPVEDLLLLLRSAEVSVPERIAGVILPIDAVEKDFWIDLKGAKRAHGHDDFFLPRGGGLWWDKAGIKRFLYTTSGPSPTMKLMRRRWCHSRGTRSRDLREVACGIASRSRLTREASDRRLAYRPMAC